MKKKLYVTPQLKVLEVKQAQLLCASPGLSTEQLEEEEFVW